MKNTASRLLMNSHQLLAVLIFVGQFLLINDVNAATTCKEKFGIIHNTNVGEPTIMLGVNSMGNLNTDDGCGTTQPNSSNATKFTDGVTNIAQVNPGSVGISYRWNGGPKVDSNGKQLYITKKNGNVTFSTVNNGAPAIYPNGWYDSTSQGSKWESWSAGAVDSIKKQAWASVSKQVSLHGSVSMIAGQSIENKMALKSFVVDPTSVQSTVIIKDSLGYPMLEITHIYGPTSGVTNQSLFQGLVTITNISGMPLEDVRYRRSMDWDVLENTGGGSSIGPMVDAKGVKASYDSLNYPRIWSYCKNGGEDNNWTSPFDECSKPPDASLNVDSEKLQGQIGSSFNFKFDSLACNESATFYIYYGASNNRKTLEDHLSLVGATTYSIGYDPVYPLFYTFGFKGVSGSAVAPVLPTKVASLPAGGKTDPDVWQTYAPPLLGNGYLYQALFKYRENKQWFGEVKRYTLDDSGAIAGNPLLASEKLKEKAKSKLDGRSIWTVGSDCKATPSKLPVGKNNFTTSNSAIFQDLLTNCLGNLDQTATNSLIDFTRGFNSNLEDPGIESDVRSSVLGDTYHSEMVLVGKPSALSIDPSGLSIEDQVNFKKSEAYYRNTNKYDDFKSAQKDRAEQIYVGANDGMLHAFDANLNEQWAFIPPSVLPLLPKMINKNGESNSIFSVDGPIVVKDVYIESTWKTVLMGGLGWGGNSYYALDVTDPAEPKHLFTINNDVNNKVINYWNAVGAKSTFAYNDNCVNFDYSKLGGAWSRPVIMLMPYGATQRWVAVFGGGYSGGASVTGTGSTSSFGGYVYILELEPNKSISTDSCGATGNNIIGSTGGHSLVKPIKLAVDADAKNDIPNGVTAHLTVVTGDGTSQAKYYGGIAYFTDLQGKLWKFNLSQDALEIGADKDLFTLSQFNTYAMSTEARLGNDRMAYNQLATTIVDDRTQNSGSRYPLINYFGTGDLIRIQRRTPDIRNRIYGVIDSEFPKRTLKQTNQTVSNREIVPLEVDKTCVAPGKSWYANVWERTNQASTQDYQKIIGRAAVQNKSVYFSAYQPDLSASCSLYGSSRIIQISETCTDTGVSGDLGLGLATAPIADGKGNIYVGMSNMKPGEVVKSGFENIARVGSGNSSSSKVQYKSWREKRAY